MINRPNKIVVHHSLTKDGETVSWPAIERFHRYYRGWIDVGYHAGCEIVGDGDVVCMYGRPWDQIGAHTQGHNVDTLGFCFVGNYDEIEPDPMMLAVAAQRVLAPWCKSFGISPTSIYGHRNFASNRTCPGRLFSVDLLIDLVEAEME